MRIAIVIIVVWSVSVISAAAATEKCPNTISSWSVAENLPLVSQRNYRGVALPKEAAKAILCPCSRQTPGLGDDYFNPKKDEIADLESKISEYLKQNASPLFPEQWKKLPSYARQYLGVIREGHRFVHVNLFPLPNDEWRNHAVGFCDGGPQFFAVEYDLAERRFHHISFNGTV